MALLNKDETQPKICNLYGSKKDSLLKMAKDVLKGESWYKLDFTSLINTLEFVLEKSEDEANILKFHKILSEMIGDKKGKLSPLAIPFLIYPSPSRKPIKMNALKISFDENCTSNMAKSYASSIRNWRKNQEVGHNSQIIHRFVIPIYFQFAVLSI